MSLKERFENGLSHMFMGMGRFIGRRPILVIVISCILTVVFSLGLFWYDETSNVREAYSPQNSPSRFEYAVAREFLNQNGTLDPSYAMIESKDGGNMLRDNYREQLQELIKHLQNNVSIEYHGKTWFFRDLCEPYCELNTAFLAFLKLYDAGNPSTYTYPNIDVFGTLAFIGNNVYNIKLKNGTNELEKFTTVILPFYLVSHSEDEKVIYNWLLEAKEVFKLPQYDIFDCGMTGDLLISAEVRRMGMETAPLIVGSVTAMIIFVVISSFRRDPSRAKPWESFLGCIIPLLALVASSGILSFAGMKFQSIIVASLFLVLSVGVDDVFIILRAWDRTSATLSVEERMGITLEEAGPSITISMVTNAMAFFIGMTSSTPAVQAFSLYSAVAIIVCFFYQLIMFSAVLAMSGVREAKGLQSILCCLKANPQARSRMVENVVEMQTRFIAWWSRAVTKWPVRIVLVLMMISYYYLSTVGIMQLRTLISLEKMTLPDSYVQHFQGSFEKALKNMQPISVFIKNPGDLRDKERMQEIKEIVHQFETANYSYGPESTFFWIRQYEEFLEYYVDESEDEDSKPDFTYTEIPTFFKSASYFYLETFVKMNATACDLNLPACIGEFFFITNFAGVIQYHELIPAVTAWRAIAANHSDFGVSSFSDHAPFVDQTMVIDQTVWSSVGAALVCTAIACVIFIPNLGCIVCAVLSVFSITVGILGLLSLWDIQLDPLSMAALLMAIGFSVDFTAHICYHFYKADHADPIHRMEETLSSIGWPLMQVGLSTIVALAPLLFKQSYLALVFLKTIIVVVLLGMWHGLVILPAVLTGITKTRKLSTPASSSDVSERSSQRSHERKESFYKTQALINRINQEFGKNKIVPEMVVPEKAGDKPALKHKIAVGRTQSNSPPTPSTQRPVVDERVEATPDVVERAETPDIELNDIKDETPTESV